MRSVEIMGGGLAGLALGLGLRHRGVPVTVCEAGSYPRHRACGEFIHGLETSVIERLGLAPVLADAPRCHRVSWHQGTTAAHAKQWRLLRPALVVSRGELDARLADALLASGGELQEGVSVPATNEEGRVWATGRRPDARSPWIGLKVHVEEMPLTGDLEFHVGHRGYVGLCALGGGRVNICGLFRHNRLVRSRATTGLAPHLRAAGLDRLADRVEHAVPRPESFCAVAGLRFGRQPLPAASGTKLAQTPLPVIGDAYAVVPPYTGNGMAMAFAGAAAAVDPLHAWSRGDMSWPATVSEIMRREAQLFARRLRRAASLHPFLLVPLAVRVATWFQHCHVVPLRRLSAMFG